MLERRPLYRLPRTTRGSHPLNINHLQLDSSSHHSSYLGLTNHPHLQLIDTHTYKPHTYTHRLFAKSWFAPAVFSERYTRVWFLCAWPWTVACYSDCFLPAPTSDRFTWTVFASRLPWPSAWYSTLSLSIPCCSALPIFDPVLSDYSY